MTQRSLSALIVLNIVLLVGLFVTVLSPQPAAAQFGGGANYMMIAGAATGRANQDAVYIIDLNSTKLVAVMYNTANNKLDVLDGRVVSTDITTGGASR